MLAIRFFRIGRRNRPSYRITVSEKSKDTFGDFLEILGYYDPRSKACEVRKDRILYWLSVGAQPSPRVHNLLVDQNIIPGPKVKTSIRRSKKKKGEEQSESASEDTAASKQNEEKGKEEQEDEK